MPGALADALAAVLDDAAAVGAPSGSSGPTPAAVLVALWPEPHESVGVEALLASLHAVLTLRRADLRRHAGEIAFPGGRWDSSDRSLYDTALREAREEIGLESDLLIPLGALTAVYTIATNYVIHPFVALLDAPPPAGRPWRAAVEEVAAVLEPSLAQLREGIGRTRLTRRGITFETDSYTVGEHVIWGATARILADLLARIETIAEPA